ncbi:MAG: hypothetical protein JWP93_2332 [Polaromonas sp.]|nr:hypothetical protein [Polaromonas sp.]
MPQNVGTVEYDVTLNTQGLINGQRDVERKLGSVGKAGDKLKTQFSGIATAISAALSAIAIEGLVSKVIAAQRQFDVLFASLKTMTGGADQASAAWERLVEFAAKTPYSLEQAVQGFTKLKALGLDPSERAMMSYGNTAAAMGKDLMQMIEAVADAATGEFERLKEFGIKAKVEGDNVSLTFQGVTTKIKNNATQITEYLTKIGEVQFGGAMSERMKTLDGDISNMEDSLQALYLSISQSGFGDVIAKSVRAATEAIQEMTASIKEGGLTEYFDKLKPYIAAAEVAVTTLAAVITGRLVAAMAASVAQAYAAATAIGAATVAARGFTAALALMGGPIGIAITALALLALNWDKVGGEARDAATMSEDAANRIANALRKSTGAAGKALVGQLAEVDREIGDINKELANTKFPMADPAQLAELKERKNTLVAISKDIAKAIGGLAGQGDPTELARRGRPVKREAEPAKPASSGGNGGGNKKGKGQPFDSAGYLSGLTADSVDAWAKIDVVETEAVRKADAHLKAKEITRQEHETAITAIAANAALDRQAIMDAEFNKTVQDGERRMAERDKGRTVAQEAIAGVNPIDALRLEEEQKIAVIEEFRLLDIENTWLYEDAKLAIKKATAEKIKAVEDDLIVKQQAAQSAQLQSYGQLFAGIAGVTKSFAGEQSGIYKAMFAVSKAFAIADAIIKIQQGIANAAALPFPANLPAIGAVVAATSSIVSTIGGTNFSGGRQYGGPANSGNLYRVNEKGAPEMFTAGNGQQYMMPTQSGRVTAADQVGGKQGLTVIINNAPAGTTAGMDGQARLIIDMAVKQSEANHAGQIRDNSGPIWSALRGASNVQGRM